MEPLLYSLLVGIISSIFATALLVAVAELTRRILLPWYADKIYRGARVEGQWHVSSVEAKSMSGAPISMDLQLKQRGDVVTGTYSHRSSDGEITSYEFSGQIRDRYLAAKIVPASEHQVDMGALLLYLGHADRHLTLTGYPVIATSPLNVAPWGPLKFALQ